MLQNRSHLQRSAEEKMIQILTILCSIRNLMVSRTPDEIRLEVHPKKILHLTPCRYSGSL
jgi:hypothetical protein